MAEQQAKEMNWSRPDLEQARLCSMLSDINAAASEVSAETNDGKTAVVASPGDMLCQQCFCPS